MAQASAAAQKIEVAQHPPAPVRVAIKADEEAIYALLLEFHRSTDGYGFPLSADKLTAHVEAGTRIDIAARSNQANLMRGLIGVIDGDDGRIAATVGLFITEAVWWSPVEGWTAQWVLVRPGERAKRHERDLFRFCWWAQDFMKERLPLATPFPLFSGPLNIDPRRLAAMERLWRRVSDSRHITSIFMRE